jgi:hypothetical protein
MPDCCAAVRRNLVGRAASRPGPPPVGRDSVEPNTFAVRDRVDRHPRGRAALRRGRRGGAGAAVPYPIRSGKRGVRRGTPDTGCQIPDARYRMPDVGRRRSGARQVATDNGLVGRSTRSVKMAAASCRTPHAGAVGRAALRRGREAPTQRRPTFDGEQPKADEDAGAPTGGVTTRTVRRVTAAATRRLRSRIYGTLTTR